MTCASWILIAVLTTGSLNSPNDDPQKREAGADSANTPKRPAEIEASRPNQISGVRFFGLAPNDFSIVSLIKSPDIQADLILSSKQCEEIASILADYGRAQKQLIMQNRSGNNRQTTDLYKRSLTRLSDQFDNHIQKVLKPDQNLRLLQVKLQLEGPPAVLHEAIATRLNIGPDQLTYLREIMEERAHATAANDEEYKTFIRSLEQAARKTDGSIDYNRLELLKKQPVNKRAFAYLEYNRKSLINKTDQLIWKNLSRKQKDRFVQLQGQPFTARDSLDRMTPDKITTP